jgi:hypothetical protein
LGEFLRDQDRTRGTHRIFLRVGLELKSEVRAMKFNIKALAVASAILWAGAVLVVALVNLIVPSYAQQFLEMVASIYPGYHANHTISQVIVVTLYAIADGLIGGSVFAWLYNWLAKAA